MSPLAKSLQRRCWDRLSQDWFNEGFVTIVAKQLHDLGKLAEIIIALEEA